MLRQLWRAYFSESNGASSIEYAIIAGFLSIVIVGTVNGLGSQVVRFFQSVADAF